MKNVTIKDVAKAAGVSYSTVSRALSGSPEISVDTRERILQVCKEMNYTANTVARAMVMKSTKLLGLILTGVNNPFMSDLAYHIDRQARARGYNIILCNSSRDLEQEKELFELMIGRQVDGIILVPSGPESYEKLRPYLSRLPTVFVGENLLAKQLFAQERNFSAIFAATDTNALGVIQAAEESGVRIPEDISLLGFDNIRYSSLPRIHLTTIEQPMKMLASVAVDSLLDKIQSELAGYTHRILTPTLIERSTCRAIK